MLQVYEHVNRLLKSIKPIRLLIIAAFTIFFCTQVIGIFTVGSSARQQGLSKTPFHVMLKVHYWFFSPTRNSLVAIRYAGNSVFQVAQIKGLPTEQIKLSGKQLILGNGEVINLHPNLLNKFTEPFTLEKDQFLVASGLDANNQAQLVGLVSSNRIIGQVLW